MPEIPAPGGGPARPHPNQLDAAAAEISDNPVGFRDPGQHPRGREARLFRAVDDFDRHAASALDFGGKRLPVARVTHSGGRHHRQMIDPDRLRERDEAPQIDEGESRAFGVQAAGRGDTPAETAHHLLVDQREQRGAEPLEHDEPQ